MIFAPYKDESTIIQRIQKVRNDDYVLLRLTATMIEKNNLDANEYFRELLLNHDIVDYETLNNGGSNGINFLSTLILPKDKKSVRLKFYRVKNARGDRRFSIETIKRKCKDGILNVGDLIYISAYMDSEKKPSMFLINLSHNSPSEKDIIEMQNQINLSGNQIIEADYDTISNFIKTMVGLFILLVVVFMSGYLFIYNTLYISVNRDIRYLGQLKTIGTTSIQIRKMIYKQMLWNSTIRLR